ncbi:MAG: SufS family cysteine desulfurase [Anaerolineae bacterium]
MIGPPAAGGAVAPAAAIDPAAIRRAFPLLAADPELIYLDSAATAQKPQAVLDALLGFYTRTNANVHRGAYTLAADATLAYEAARARIARFVGAADASEIVFTRGTTEAINLVAGAWGPANVGPGDAIVVTELEHHSNLVPWHRLAERTGCELRAVPITPDGRLDMAAFERIVDERVRLVAVGHISNAVGTINPVADIVALARRSGALVLLDAAQSVAHRPVDVRALGVDFLAASGHKMMGPMGIGFLWARAEILAAMPPWQGGGEMIRRVTATSSTYADPPQRFEAGTPAVADAVALAAAADYLDALGLDACAAHDAALVAHALEQLSDAPGVRIAGPLDPAQRSGSVAFTVDDVHAHDLATLLDGDGICIRAGHHCAMPLHTRLGLTATARASFQVYNGPDDVDALVAAIARARGVFGA